MAININTLNAGNMTIGSSQPPAEPSPYFTYDSNRNITGIAQGNPNVPKKIGFTEQEIQEWQNAHEGETPEDWQITAAGDTYYTEYFTVFTLGLSQIHDDYALGVADGAFNNDTFQASVFSQMENVGRYDSDDIVGSFGYSFTSIELPNATSIGEEAFVGCEVQTVNLPNVSSVGNGAFTSCSNLGTVVLPNATSFGDGVFYGCNGLQSVNVNSLTTSFVSSTEMFYDAPSGCTITCSDGTITI